MARLLENILFLTVSFMVPCGFFAWLGMPWFMSKKWVVSFIIFDFFMEIILLVLGVVEKTSGLYGKVYGLVSLPFFVVLSIHVFACGWRLGLSQKKRLFWSIAPAILSLSWVPVVIWLLLMGS